MSRTSSVSRRLIGETLEVHVSARRIPVEDHKDDEQRNDQRNDDQRNIVQVLSSEGDVSFRIKPDRRAVDTVMPLEHDRRRL